MVLPPTRGSGPPPGTGEDGGRHRCQDPTVVYEGRDCDTEILGRPRVPGTPFVYTGLRSPSDIYRKREKEDGKRGCTL